MLASPRAAALCLASLAFFGAGIALANAGAKVVQLSDMSVLPDQEYWERIGASHAYLPGDGTLVINDNSRAERIAFETWSGAIEASFEVHVRARLRVISNLAGQAVTIELARPGLEIILRLYPDRLVLVERDGSDFLWLASHDADLADFVEIELIKRASADGEVEQVEVLVGGSSVMSVLPSAAGTLGVGRIIVGSLSYEDEGGSIWDWIELERFEAGGLVRTERRSLGSLKALFDAP
jgi:hypothetical protein